MQPHDRTALSRRTVSTANLNHWGQQAVRKVRPGLLVALVGCYALGLLVATLVMPRTSFEANRTGPSAVPAESRLVLSR